jgi:hypothetical protein
MSWRITSQAVKEFSENAPAGVLPYEGNEKFWHDFVNNLEANGYFEPNRVEATKTLDNPTTHQKETVWGLVKSGDIVDFNGGKVIVETITQDQPNPARPYRHTTFTYRQVILTNAKVEYAAIIQKGVKAQKDETTIYNA